MQVIGLCGFANSGKSTFANRLVDQHGFIRLSFASALKDVVAALFHWDRARLEGRTPEDRAWREVPDTFWSAKMGQPWSPRWALQFVGTEVMRNNLHKNIWVERVAAQLHALGPDAKVVFDDARFTNELAMLNSFGATLLVLDRQPFATPEHAWRWNAAFHGTPLPADFTGTLHASETEWLASPFITTAIPFTNDGDLDAFHTAIDAFYADLS